MPLEVVRLSVDIQGETYNMDKIQGIVVTKAVGIKEALKVVEELRDMLRSDKEIIKRGIITEKEFEEYKKAGFWKNPKTLVRVQKAKDKEMILLVRDMKEMEKENELMERLNRIVEKLNHMTKIEREYFKRTKKL